MYSFVNFGFMISNLGKFILKFNLKIIWIHSKIIEMLKFTNEHIICMMGYYVNNVFICKF